jgi:hypothetical protein
MITFNQVSNEVSQRVIDGDHVIREALLEYEGCQTWEDVESIATARTHSAVAAQRFLHAFIHDTIRAHAQREIENE